ncbi:hypothetical protein CEXT_157561 [Caerostris extrusa]|uniref:Uncharacterized protein n=1 Tax=Caerostris extrusa TaxID=172846 RepID=A0AAV4P7R2_CAEEX|nr:hypothetical protein CEXT_157561 [Caerostris extrusa]
MKSTNHNINTRNSVLFQWNRFRILARSTINVNLKEIVLNCTKRRVNRSGFKTRSLNENGVAERRFLEERKQVVKRIIENDFIRHTLPSAHSLIPQINALSF